LNGQADLAAAGRIALRGRLDAAGSPAAYRAAVVMQQLVPGTLRVGWPSEPLDGTLRGSCRGSRLRAHGKPAPPSLEVAFRGQGAFGDAAFTRVRAAGTVRDLAQLGGPAGRLSLRLAGAGRRR